ERKYCRPQARPFRLGFPRKVPVLSRATSRTLGSSEAGCRWYAHICDRGVIERKSHERGPKGKDRYGTITNPNPASRGARGLAPIPVHRLKAPLRRGIFPTNHSGWVLWMMGIVSTLVGRHGAMKPAGRARIRNIMPIVRTIAAHLNPFDCASHAF